MDQSACLNTRSLNPISSFHIFIPKVTFRRSDSIPPRAASSCTRRFTDMISDIFEKVRKSSSGIHSVERSVDGKLGSFLRDSHISRVEPVRPLSLLESIFTNIFSLVFESEIAPIS